MATPQHSPAGQFNWSTGSYDPAPMMSVSGSKTGAGSAGGEAYQGVAYAAQAFGSYFSYMGQREQYKTQEVIAKFNARMAMMQAEEKADRIRRTGQRLRGAQRAAIGASGLAFDGNAIEVIADSMYEFELDVAAVKQSAILSRTNSLISANTASVNASNASASAALGLVNTAAEAAQYLRG